MLASSLRSTNAVSTITTDNEPAALIPESRGTSEYPRLRYDFETIKKGRTLTQVVNLIAAEALKQVAELSTNTKAKRLEMSVALPDPAYGAKTSFKYDDLAGLCSGLKTKFNQTGDLQSVRILDNVSLRVSFGIPTISIFLARG